MTIFVHFGAFWAEKPISRPRPFDRLRTGFDRLRVARATEYPERPPQIPCSAQALRDRDFGFEN